jgi:uncharacterized membrane protein YhaH (DUF805 family)
MENITNEHDYISEKTKGCPICGKKLKAAAETCPACGARFEVQTRAYCTHCHKLIVTNPDNKCPDCQGSDLLDPRLFSKLTIAGIPPVKPTAQGTPVPAETEPTAAAETKKCPCCAETIKAEARLCRFCGARFEVAIKGYCTTCHAEMTLNENDQCSRCGGAVIDRHIASALVGAPAEAPTPVPVSAPPAPVSRPAAVPAPVAIPAAPVAAVSAPPENKAHMPFWQLYLSPKGRIGRLTFFLKGMLPVWGLLGLCEVIIVSITNSLDTSRLSGATGTLLSIGMIILLLGILLLCWVILMLIIKRFHDLDRSGWNILVWLIPLVGQVINLVNTIQLYFVKGSDGPNRFGDSAD